MRTGTASGSAAAARKVRRSWPNCPVVLLTPKPGRRLAQVSRPPRTASDGAVPEADLRELMAGTLDAPRWDDVAGRCLTCGNCTMVCPTCFCTTTEDVTDLTGDHAERWRLWDSCFDLDFSHLHGGPVRASWRSRYRQWMTHKLGTWHDQFGSSGCVSWPLHRVVPRSASTSPRKPPPCTTGRGSRGSRMMGRRRDRASRLPGLRCGRTAAGRRVTMSTVVPPLPSASPGPGRDRRHPVDRTRAGRTGTPVLRTGAVRDDLRVQSGEVPISASALRGRHGGLVHTVRAVGAVCDRAVPGSPGQHRRAQRALRYRLDLDAAVGHDVLVIAGGIGLAPLPAGCAAVLDRPAAYGRLAVLVGARTPADLVYRDEIESSARSGPGGGDRRPSRPRVARCGGCGHHAPGPPRPAARTDLRVRVRPR